MTCFVSEVSSNRFVDVRWKTIGDGQEAIGFHIHLSPAWMCGADLLLIEATTGFSIGVMFSSNAMCF